MVWLRPVSCGLCAIDAVDLLLRFEFVRNIRQFIRGLNYPILTVRFLMVIDVC